MLGKCVKTLGRFGIYVVGQITYWLAAVFGLIFYIPLFKMLIVELEERPDLGRAAAVFFGLFLFFAAIHCVWMWFFYKINILSEIFQSQE
jgi:hypothetical protein